MTRTLDRNRPHGQIYGISEVPGAVFEQDGCFFNNAGDCVYEPPKAEAAPAAAEPETTAAPVADDRRTKLEALHATNVKKLVVELGLDPAVGAGSKARNIEMIMAAEATG